MKLGLSGRKVLVVGASQGLGKAIAIAFAEEGCQVIAAARSVGKIEAWRSDLPQELAGHIDVKRLDLSDTASIDALAEELLASGGVDILINNGGGPAPGTALTAQPDAWDAAFSSMASSVFRLTGRLVAPMIDRGFGRIITIGSSGIVQPIADLAMSNGVRAAVAGWSKSLASAVAKHGVTVNMILPGRIDTDRVKSLDASRADREKRSVSDIQTASFADIPAGRYGKPEEFAAVAVFLASEPAAYVTGSMVRVDGGMIRSL